MQMETVVVFPDHLHAEMHTPDGVATIVVTPDAAFVDLPNGAVQNWPEARKNETLEQIKRDPIFIAAHSKDPNVFFRADGSEKVGDIDARIVDVNAAGAAIRWFRRPADRPHLEGNLQNYWPERSCAGRNRFRRLETSKRPESPDGSPQQTERSGFQYGGI